MVKIIDKIAKNLEDYEEREKTARILTPIIRQTLEKIVHVPPIEFTIEYFQDTVMVYHKIRWWKFLSGKEPFFTPVIEIVGSQKGKFVTITVQGSWQDITREYARVFANAISEANLGFDEIEITDEV